MSDPVAEINDCEYQLFRRDVQQETPGSLNIAGAVISGVTRIDVTNDSRAFELLWYRFAYVRGSDTAPCC
jgi:hypothetical protein